MAQIVVQKVMLYAVNGSMRLNRYLFESYPNQNGTADIIPYNKDIIGLLSVKIENDDITHKIKKPIIVRAFPADGINQSRVEMLQTFILKTKKSGKQYWSGVPFNVDKAEDSINIVIEEPGIYKITY